MENKIKRFLSLLLALVMVLGMFPAGHAHVHAEEVSKTEMAIVDATPDAPEAGKQYVIAVKRSNGEYWAMTSDPATFNGHGCLKLKNTTVAEAAAVDAEAVWTVVNTEGGFKLRHSDGRELSLESTINEDAFLRDVGEVVTFPVANAEANTYYIKTGFNRYINALGGQNGATSVGNYGSGTPLHFFEVKTTINMEKGETYSITLPGYYSNVTGTDVVTAAASVELGTVVRPVRISGTAFSTENEIESGTKFVVMSNRNGKYLTDRYVEASAKTGLELVDKVEDASVWTFTKVGDNYAVSAENGNIFIGSTDNKVMLSKTEVVTVSAGSGDDLWEIYRPDDNKNNPKRCLNEFNSFGDSSGNNYAASAYTKNDGHDVGSQWKLFPVEETKEVSYREVTKQFVTGGQYIFQNTRKGTAMSNVESGNVLTLKSMNTITPDMVWTVIADQNGYQVKDQSGNYLTFGQDNTGNFAKTVDTAATITFEKKYNVGQSYNQRFTWALIANNTALNDVNGTAAGWHGNDNLNTAKNDAGSQWRSYMPVANTTVTFEAVKAGTADITIGDTTYTFHVTAPAGDHEHSWSEATCKEPATCAVCGETTGDVDPNNHVRITTTGAVKPTLCEPGRTGTTVCGACGVTVKADEEITQLPVAAVLIDTTVTNNAISTVGTKVALSDCEYVYTAANEANTRGSFSHVIDGIPYYVKPCGDNSHAQVPHIASEFVVTLHWGDGDNAGKVQIDGNGGLHFWHDRGKPWWDRCGSGTGDENTDWAGHGLTLFIADGNTENTPFPGYSKVTAADKMVDGASYLIAAQNGETYGSRWFVMHPSKNLGDNAYAYEHIAEYIGMQNITGHTPVAMNEDVDPTFENTGLTGGERCSVCRKIVTPQTVVPAGYNTGVVPATDIIPKDGNHQNNHDKEGPASFALDDDFSTMWHSDWYGADRKDLWIEFELTAEYVLSGLYYKPRAGAQNGTIKEYKILVSYDGETYVEFMSGDWTKEDGSVDDTWKIVEFENDIQVKKVRLMADESVSDQEGVNFASAAEIRLVGTPTGHVHSFDAVVTAPTCTEQGYTTYTCSEETCGDSYVANYVDALDHEFDDDCDTECNRNCGEEGGTREPKHTAAEEAVVENTTEVSYDEVYYCQDCDAEIYRHRVYTEVVVHSMNVLLDSEIQMQYAVSIPEAMENPVIVLTKEGGYGTVVKTFVIDADFTSYWTEERGSFYEVAIGIASGEMTCPVKIEVLENGEAVELYNKTRTMGTSASRSVVDYAVTALANEDNSAEKKDLIKAMLVYGSYAQINFQVDTDNLAYTAAGLGDLPSVEQVTANTVAAYVNKQDNDTMGVTASKVTAFVDSDIYLRVYLAVEGNIEDYQFSIAPSYDEETERYYVDLTGIASALVDSEFGFTVTNADGVTNTITTSMLSYVRSVLSNENNSGNKQNLVKALYLYNQAANTFFGK